MSLPWIVVGDRTSHGGTVLEGDPWTDIQGKPVATVGHQVSCPKYKGAYPIATGAPDTIISGRPVACHGDQTACGASLISSQMLTYWGAGRDGASFENRLQNITETTATNLDIAPNMADSGYDEHFVLQDEAGRPIAGLAYGITASDGEQDGYTGQDGKTIYTNTDTPQPVALTYAVQLEIGVRE